MGISKTSLFTPEQNQLANFAKAFSHPARIAILQELLKGQCICGELVGITGLSQSTVSQHLKALKEIGIIKGEIEGPKTCYCINKKGWEDAQKALFSVLQQSPTCC